MKISRKDLEKLISEVMAEQRVPGESTARSEQAYRRNSPAGTRRRSDKGLNTARRRRDRDEINWALMDADGDGDIDIVNMTSDYEKIPSGRDLNQIVQLLTDRGIIDDSNAHIFKNLRKYTDPRLGGESPDLAINAFLSKLATDVAFGDETRLDSHDILRMSDLSHVFNSALEGSQDSIDDEMRRDEFAEEPRDIVHARLGEVYKENAMEADLAIWLEKNPEFKLVPPGTKFSGWWGTDIIDEENWYVDGPEEGPINESKETQMSKGFGRSDIKSWFAQTLYEDFETSKPRKRRSTGILTEATVDERDVKVDDYDEYLIMISNALVLGIEALFGRDLSEDDEYELGQDFRRELEDHPDLTNKLAKHFESFRMGSSHPEPSEAEYGSHIDFTAADRAELLDQVASEIYDTMDSADLNRDRLDQLVKAMADAKEIDINDWEISNFNFDEVRDRVVEFEEEAAEAGYTGL